MKVKLILLTSVTLLMTLAISAQTVTRETPIWQDDVPNPVLRAFKSVYPKANPRSYTKVEVDGVPLFYRIEIAEKACIGTSPTTLTVALRNLKTESLRTNCRLLPNK